MYQELHMWDECIVVAEAKVQNIASPNCGLGLLGKSPGSESNDDLDALHLAYQDLISAWRGSQRDSEPALKVHHLIRFTKKGKVPCHQTVQNTS